MRIGAEAAVEIHSSYRVISVNGWNLEFSVWRGRGECPSEGTALLREAEDSVASVDAGPAAVSSVSSVCLLWAGTHWGHVFLSCPTGNVLDL